MPAKRRPSSSSPSEPSQRFIDSMTIDYDKWHDGIGYDLDALGELEGDERDQIEARLVSRREEDWRDVEALAALGTPKALSALRTNLTSGDFELRIRSAERLMERGEIDDIGPFLVEALGPSLYADAHFSRVLDVVGKYKSLAAIPALLAIAHHGEGQKAASAVSMLLYLRGLSTHPFDWTHRPFFLRFNTTDMNDRAAAFNELCEKIGLPAQR